MFVRLSSVKRGSKIYNYAQLVESTRPKPGAAPVHRVVANLGRVTDMAQIENLRAALNANRDGGRVASVTAEREAVVSRPRAVLRYLDVAVVVRMLSQLGVLDELGRLLPQANSEVSPAHVVAALVAQRCVAPQSKLHAVRWFPRTALPELLGVAPEQFNNTRVHRTLEMLEQVEGDLMRGLSRQIVEREGSLSVSFLDLTDTYFEGAGPELSARGKTKEGLLRKKVGIALLCSPTGLPLRWQVVVGNRPEPSTMLDMMRSTQVMSWLSSTPMVVDRAMGCTTYVRQMLEIGVPFITALRVMEHESYFADLPASELLDLEPASKRDEERCAEEATRRIERLGFERVADNQFCRDAGIVRVPGSGSKKRVKQQQVQSVLPSIAMQIARSVDEAVASGRFRTYAAAGRFFGHELDRVKSFRGLRVLPEGLQQRVMEGDVDSISRRQIALVGKMDEADQEEAFEQLVRLHRRRSSSPTQSALPQQPSAAEHKLQVRCAAYFNPIIFATQRRLAAKQVAEVERYIQKLNEKLRDNPGRKQPSTLRREIEERLRRSDLILLFDIDVVETNIGGTRQLEAKVTLNKSEWQQRRRSDGFSVIVADPRIELSAEQLCRMYRAKDAVETDFQVIKSLLKLRPVRHRTDLKVRAHVTLCMLALLVQRSAHQLLAPLDLSAQLAFELFEPCRLAAHQPSERSRPSYVLTHPDAEQSRILRHLGLTQLVDELELQRSLSPRATFVTTVRQKTS